MAGTQVASTQSWQAWRNDRPHQQPEGPGWGWAQSARPEQAHPDNREQERIRIYIRLDTTSLSNLPPHERGDYNRSYLSLVYHPQRVTTLRSRKATKKKWRKLGPRPKKKIVRRLHRMYRTDKTWPRTGVHRGKTMHGRRVPRNGRISKAWQRRRRPRNGDPLGTRSGSPHRRNRQDGAATADRRKERRHRWWTGKLPQDGVSSDKRGEGRAREGRGRRSHVGRRSETHPHATLRRFPRDHQ